jgi:hypothetical protein
MNYYKFDDQSRYRERTAAWLLVCNVFLWSLWRGTYAAAIKSSACTISIVLTKRFCLAVKETKRNIMQRLYTVCAVLTALLAAHGQLAMAQMVGGNGLCADPASLGPNRPVGTYAPIRNPQDDSAVTNLAKVSAIVYFFGGNMTPEDAAMVKACGANKAALVNNINVKAACSQVADGTNYIVEYTVTIPCSDTNKKKLPPGADFTRTIRAEGHQDPGESKPQYTGVQGVSPQDDFCGSAVAAGGYTPIDNPSNNPIVVQNAKISAQYYWDNDQSADFRDAVNACGSSEQDFINSVQVTQACSQVTSGTNNRIGFIATLQCPYWNSQQLPPGFLLKRSFVSEVSNPDTGGSNVIVVENTGGLLGGNQVSPSGALLESEGVDTSSGAMLTTTVVTMAAVALVLV